jgi:hypothetical protein
MPKKPKWKKEEPSEVPADVASTEPTVPESAPVVCDCAVCREKRRAEAAQNKSAT